LRPQQSPGVAGSDSFPLTPAAQTMGGVLLVVSVSYPRAMSPLFCAAPILLPLISFIIRSAPRSRPSAISRIDEPEAIPHSALGYRPPGDEQVPGSSKSEPAADDCDVDSLIRPVQNPGAANSIIRKHVTVRLVTKRRCV